MLAASCDLCVCDVNMDATLACKELLLPLAPLLAPRAGLVLTIKLPRRCSDHRVALLAADCAAMLGPAFEGFRLEHLFANTGNERTLLARRRGGEGGAAAGDAPPRAPPAVVAAPAPSDACPPQTADSSDYVTPQ